MPRRARLRLAGIPFHVIQRGNNRSPCFFSDGDRLFYLACLREQASRRRVAVHAYVLMTNHAHLLMTPESDDGVGELMKYLGQRYVQYINRRYERTGTLWEGRFRSCLVDAESYLLTCHRYIEMNPVRAGIVSHPAEYGWSTYRANALGEANPLLTPHPLIESLAATAEERQTAYRQLFMQDIDARDAGLIRAMTNGGFVLGSSRFQETVAEALSRRVVPGTAGRPMKTPGKIRLRKRRNRGLSPISSET